MSGVLTPLGVRSLGGVLPVLATAEAAIVASVAPAMAELNAKLAGLLAVQAALLAPPLPSVTIAGAALALVSLQATLAVPQPTSPQLVAALAVIAQVRAQLGALEAQLSVAAELGALGNAGGIAAYAYAGTIDALGPAVTAELGGGIPGGAGADQGNALVLVTTTPGTWISMRAAFAI